MAAATPPGVGQAEPAFAPGEAELGDGLLDRTMNTCPQPVYAAMREHGSVLRTVERLPLVWPRRKVT